MAKRSYEASKMAALLGAHIGAPVEEGIGLPDVSAVLAALDRHKSSADHTMWPQIWEKLNKFLEGLETNGIMPIYGDTADIGSATRLFRKGYFSELSTLIFKKENVLVMDGSLVLTKQSGKLVGDVSAGDSQIDFGQALTVGDWLILRAENKMEIIQVGSLVSGTTYKVSRNVDGSGANDWPMESVYFVRGHEGDGWIELSATDQVNRRVSFFNQGSTWSDTKEVIRFGLLEQWQNAGLSGMGFALGDFSAGRYIVYSSVTGLWEMAGGRMIAGRRNVIVDEDGISVTTLRDGLRFFQGLQPLGQVVSGSEMRNGVLQYFLEMMTGKEPTAFPVPDPTFSVGGGWFGDNFQFNYEDPYSPPSNARFGTAGQIGIQLMQSDLFAAVPDKTVQFGFWRRFKNGSNYARLLNTYFSLEIRYFTSTNILIRTDVLYQTNLSKEVANADKPTWERVSGIGPKAPSNAVKADLTFMLSNTSDMEWADIDDIELVGFNQVSTIRLYDDQASIDAVNGLVVNGPIQGSNVSAVPTANAIIQAGANGKAAAGWIPDLSATYLKTLMAVALPSANKLPLAKADGRIDAGWLPGVLINPLFPQKTVIDSKSVAVGSTTYNVSSYGIPSSAKVIFVRVFAAWANLTGASILGLGPAGSTEFDVVARAISALGVDVTGFVRLNSSGQFRIQVANAATNAYTSVLILGWA